MIFVICWLPEPDSPDDNRRMSAGQSRAGRPALTWPVITPPPYYFTPTLNPVAVLT